MATQQQLKDDLTWDIGRIPTALDEHASDGALEILDEMDTTNASVDIVNAYARRDGDASRIAPKHLLRTIQRSEGTLALVTWSSGGITAIGYQPDEQRFDVGTYSAVQELMGNDTEEYGLATIAEAKSQIEWASPDVVLREEADLLPDLAETSGVTA